MVANSALVASANRADDRATARPATDDRESHRSERNTEVELEAGRD